MVGSEVVIVRSNQIQHGQLPGPRYQVCLPVTILAQDQNREATIECLLSINTAGNFVATQIVARPCAPFAATSLAHERLAEVADFVEAGSALG